MSQVARAAVKGGLFESAWKAEISRHEGVRVAGPSEKCSWYIAEVRWAGYCLGIVAHECALEAIAAAYHNARIWLADGCTAWGEKIERPAAAAEAGGGA